MITNLYFSENDMSSQGNGKVRDNLIEMLKERRRKENFKVIDLGGIPNGWSQSVVDTMVTLTEGSRIPNVFSFDMSDANAWAPLLGYIAINGKYNYCICSHTLEDVHENTIPISLLKEIADEGIIIVPTKYSEGFSNWSHHHWVFDIVNGQLVYTNKAIWVAQFRDSHLEQKKFEIVAEWKGNISISFVKNDIIANNNEV